MTHDDGFLGTIRSLCADLGEAAVLVFSGDFRGAVSVLERVVSELRRSLDAGPYPNPEPGSVRDDGSLWTIQTWFLDRGEAAAEGPDGPIPADYVWSQRGQNDEWVWQPPS